MENVNVNLADVPSFCTYSTGIIPGESAKWHEEITSKLGDNVFIEIRNKANPAYRQSFTANSAIEMHEWLYKMKMRNKATWPNKNTTKKTGRTLPNFDYEVKIMPVKDETEIQYKFNEGELIKEFQEYIDSTYGQHYAKDKFQATEFIIDGGHGTGFCIGNVMKYAQRYGKKVSSADARKDLMKVLHYALIGLYIHDNEL